MVLQATGARAVDDTHVVQNLWSGYGQIVRWALEGGTYSRVILEHVRWPDQRRHPHAWTSYRSYERKVQSYRIETAWYDRYAHECQADCRVPRRLALGTRDDEVIMVLDRYFVLLPNALERSGKALDFAALEDDWRTLYPATPSAIRAASGSFVRSSRSART